MFRPDKIARYRAAFRGEDRTIPLCLQRKSEAPPRYTRWEQTFDREKALRGAHDSASLAKGIESDYVPFLTAYPQYILVPSLFDESVFDAPGENPMPIPFLRGPEDFHRIIEFAGPFQSKAIDNATALFGYLVERAEGVAVTPPNPVAALEHALNMRGGDFYLDMLEYSEESMALLTALNELMIRQVLHFKTVCDEPMDTHLTCKGMLLPGLRIALDSIVNLSPDMIRQFMFPLLERIGEVFGGVLVHYCTLPTPSTHVLKVLEECPAVIGVDNWQGYRSLFPKGAAFSHQCFVCTDIAAGDLQKELADGFASLKGGGCAVSVRVESAAEGNELYAWWQEQISRLRESK